MDVEVSTGGKFGVGLGCGVVVELVVVVEVVEVSVGRAEEVEVVDDVLVSGGGKIMGVDGVVVSGGGEGSLVDGGGGGGGRIGVVVSGGVSVGGGGNLDNSQYIFKRYRQYPLWSCCSCREKSVRLMSFAGEYALVDISVGREQRQFSFRKQLPAVYYVICYPPTLRQSINHDWPGGKELERRSRTYLNAQSL